MRVLALSGVGSIGSPNPVASGVFGAFFVLSPSSTGKGLATVGVSSKSDLAEAAALDNDSMDGSAGLRDSRGEDTIDAVDTIGDTWFDFDGVSAKRSRSSIH
jgi:hypothetical protein